MTQAPQPVVPVCYRHPKRETYVRCTRCDRPICPECMNDAAVGHQCPECVAEGRRSQRPLRTTFGGSLAGIHGYVTIGLIVVNVVMQLISVASSGGDIRVLFGGGAWGLFGIPSNLTEWGAVKGLDTYQYDNGVRFSVPAGIPDGEYYRLFTSMFLHYGAFHLAMNMWALWVLGRTLEGVLGPVRFTALYLVSGLGGSVVAYLFTPASHGAGASGAVFGLFAALVVVLRRMGRDISSVVPVIVANLIISFAPGISLAAHVGGLVTGAIFASALAYAPRKIRNWVVAGTIVGLVLFMATLVVIQTISLRDITAPLQT